MEEIPNEILLNICIFMDKKSLLNISLTNKHINDLLHYDGFWKNKIIKDYPQYTLSYLKKKYNIEHHKQLYQHLIQRTRIIDIYYNNKYYGLLYLLINELWYDQLQKYISQNIYTAIHVDTDGNPLAIVENKVFRFKSQSLVKGFKTYTKRIYIYTNLSNNQSEQLKNNLDPTIPFNVNWI